MRTILTVFCCRHSKDEMGSVLGAQGHVKNFHKHLVKWIYSFAP
jgi:hypothetical protein